MRIVNVAVNGRNLVVFDTNRAINYYRAFMEFCIDNYIHLRANHDEFKRIVKTSSDDPTFGRAIHYERINEYNNYFYSDWLSNKEKVRIMYRIANEIGIDLQVQVI